MNQEQILSLLGIGESALFTIGDMLLAMSVTTILVVFLGKVYKDTHTGPNYSKTFFTSLIIMSISTSVVMLIIGSNIARAFSLIGALSIIRFRTAVKDPRDTAFLFAGVVTGMGCGTGFYIPSIVLVAFLAVILYILDKFEFGIKSNITSILKINTDEDIEISKAIENYCDKAILINKVNDFTGNSITHVFSFSPKKSQSFEVLSSKLKEINGVNQVNIYQADQHSPF